MKIRFSEAFVVWPVRGFTFCDGQPGGDEEFPESYEINLYKNNNIQFFITYLLTPFCEKE
jgi:hypothetical protein